MARLLYKPFGFIVSFAAGRIAAKVFAFVWARVDPEDTGAMPPRATEIDAPMGKAIAAAVVEGAAYMGTRAVVDRVGLNAFYRLTGLWAGDKPQADA